MLATMHRRSLRTAASILNNRSHPPNRNLLNFAGFPGCCERKARMPQTQRASTHCCAWPQHLTMGAHHPHPLPAACPLPESPLTSQRCRSWFPQASPRPPIRPTAPPSCGPRGTPRHGTDHCRKSDTAGGDHPPSTRGRPSCNSRPKNTMSGAQKPRMRICSSEEPQRQGKARLRMAAAHRSGTARGHRRPDNRAYLQSTRGPNNMGRTVRSQTRTP
mmetsp:Transcript_65876/g.214378  ORF Transcript_65876/g.214378 Transcript_65876/m.214378 type:complete len:217 (+) Transcript_65876:415-1065(+)